MGSNNMEIETKFYIENVSEIVDMLERISSKLVDKRFERNIIFDRDKELYRKGGVLRLRIVKNIDIKNKEILGIKDVEVLNESRYVLTAKEKVDSGLGIKSMKEYEVEVSDCDSIVGLLRVLGFEQIRVYEKIRLKYDLNGVFVDIDILPFGRFVEIEGKNEEEVHNVVDKLGLKKENMIDKSYLLLAEEQGHFEDVCF